MGKHIHDEDLGASAEDVGRPTAAVGEDAEPTPSSSRAYAQLPVWKLLEVASLYALLVIANGQLVRNEWTGSADNWWDIGIVALCAILAIGNFLYWMRTRKSLKP